LRPIACEREDETAGRRAGEVLAPWETEMDDGRVGDEDGGDEAGIGARDRSVVLTECDGPRRPIARFRTGSGTR
jgi:hypothetical protein